MSDGFFSVSNLGELMEALHQCAAGCVIALGAGHYGALELDGANATFSSEVRIVSGSDERAVFSGLRLSGVANVSFERVAFDYDARRGAPLHTAPFVIRDAATVRFLDSVFDGDAAQDLGPVHDGFGAGVGLSILGSSDIEVADSVFRDFHRGLAIGRSADIRILRNEVSGMSSDGMNFAEVRNVVIAGNHIHDFRKHPSSPAHMDMIQFWTNGTEAPSTDIVIRDNFLNRGAGSPTQSIFMRNDMVDRGLAGAELFYRNVLIENNVIYNSHSHGVTVGATAGLTIRANTLLSSAHGGLAAEIAKPTIMVADAAEGAAITGNIVAKPIAADRARHRIEGNRTLQRRAPGAPDFYGEAFFNALADASLEIGDLAPLRLSEWGEIGADIRRFQHLWDGPVGAFRTVRGKGRRSMNIVFDAPYLLGPDGPTPLVNAAFRWRVNGAAVGAGGTLRHRFAEGGPHSVALEIMRPDAPPERFEVVVDVVSPQLLRLMTARGALMDATDRSNPVEATPEVALVGPGDAAFRLNGGYVRVGGGVDMSGLAEATLSFEFQGDGDGRIADFPGGLALRFAGEWVYADLMMDAGAVRLRTPLPPVADGRWRRFALAFSGESGVAAILIDGAEVARATVPTGARLAPAAERDLIIGDPWGRASYGGLLRDFSVVAGVPDGAMTASGGDATLSAVLMMRARRGGRWAQERPDRGAQ
ncbi:MAG: right-handed parallel beta-helix repeat-containing protein [Pseudomonadota bacterium]